MPALTRTVGVLKTSLLKSIRVALTIDFYVSAVLIFIMGAKQFPKRLAICTGFFDL